VRSSVPYSCPLWSSRRRPVNPSSETGGPGQGGIIQLTPADQQLLDRKVALDIEYAAVRSGTGDAAAFQRDLQVFLATYAPGTSSSLVRSGAASPLLSSNSLSLAQHAQTKYYYCGPATAYSMLYYKFPGTTGPAGESLTQQHLAAYGTGYLDTEYYTSTPWSPAVMAPTLNAWGHTSYWVTVSSPSLSVYELVLTFDIDVGYPLAVGVYEEANTITPHLTNHPKDRIIQHWVAVHGYTSTGGNSTYADSVYGATSVSWYQDVTAPHSTISSTDMRTMMIQGSYGVIE
jgi:Peptidase_C39 like family